MNAAERRLHERTLELAASAIDFDLTSAESVDLEAHLATCTSCGRDAAGLRADALAIRPPVTLMPSQRVDDAVRREIARGGARPQRFLLLAATALILLGLLAAVAVGAALLRTQETLPMTVVPTDRAAVADPVPNASPTLGESWRTLDVPGGSSGRLIEAVTIAGAGLVGVGRGGCDTDAAKDPTACFGAAWTAGADWSITAVPDQDGLRVGLSNPTSGPEKGIYDVAFGPNGIVAVGYPLDPDVVGRPGIWRSPDGRTWQRARVDFGPPSLGVRLSAIGASERGYVAVGSLVDGTRAQGPDITARAAAWVSGDGVTWTRAADTADMNVGPCLDTLEEPSCGGMLGISPSGDGFVAVGYARTEFDACRPDPPSRVDIRRRPGMDPVGHGP